MKLLTYSLGSAALATLLSSAVAGPMISEFMASNSESQEVPLN
jgi:hypothetical protein|tara:strand:+ start:108 stop:236 length:129 start_codon:yes stop_codon:yes gene_type:complete